MPVGRFREDPRELRDEERAIYARQHAEGLLVVGSLLGTVVPLGLRIVVPGVVPPPLGRFGVLFGAFFGGIAGYLLGYAYRERQLRSIRSVSAEGSPDLSAPKSPVSDRNSSPDETDPDTD